MQNKPTSFAQKVLLKLFETSVNGFCKLTNAYVRRGVLVLVKLMRSSPRFVVIQIGLLGFPRVQLLLRIGSW